MNKQLKLIAAAVVVLAIALMTAFIAHKFAPSKEIISLDEYFGVASGEMAIILQDEISDEKGYVFDSVPYISYTMVKELFNKKFYWDSTENLLIFTTPTQMYKIQPENTEYSINKSTSNEDYVICKMVEGQVYIAAEFVQQFSDIEYQMYERPNRIVITYRWGENALCTFVKKETQLRNDASIKSPVLATLSKGDELVCIGLEEEMKSDFTKVMTVDGVIGYVQSKKIEETEYKTLQSDYVYPEYTSIKHDHDICMVWHQVTNSSANNYLLSLLNETKGVNTISPTWFSIKDNKGNVSSIADEQYVQRAHQAGVEVWGLCDDFSDEVDMSELLSKTSARQKLQNKLLGLAIEYNLDGINLDFENVPEKSGEDFIQFVREMSIKCRSNGIVLSINNYVPVDYRAYYNYEEQGEVADYVIIMAYDEHFNGGGKEGSVSSLGFVSEAVDNITRMVEPEKVIMALPFYTRLWQIKDGGQTIESAAYGMDGADSVLRDRNITPSWDSVTGQYYAEYDENNSTYKIWLEEEKSLQEKLKVIVKSGINNVSFWRMGLERAETWNAIANYINKN